MAEVSDLNRQIAEQLGWTNIHEKTYWSEDYDGEGWVTILVGSPPGREDDRPLLDYVHDLNAVLTAIPKDDALYDVRIQEHIPGDFTVRISRDEPPLGYTAHWEAEGETRQQAAANALLSLLKSKAEMKS